MRRSAADLHRRAVDLANRGRYPDARHLLATALTAVDDPNLRARILGTSAYIMSKTGAPEAAERTCREALALDGLTDETRSILYGQLGVLAWMAGQLDAAESWLTRGITAVEPHSIAGARMRVNRSLVHMHRLQLDAALADTDVALRTYARAGMGIDEAQMRHNLGYIHLLRGDLVEALSDMAMARRDLLEVSTTAASISDVDRAEVLRDAGLTTEAERILARTATVFGTHRMPQSRAEAEFNLARSLLTHDPARARRVAESAARRFRLLGLDSWAARSVAVRMRAHLSGGMIDRSGGRAPVSRRTPNLDDVGAVAADLDRYGFRSEAAALRMSRELWRARHGSQDDTAIIIRPPASASMEVRLLAHAVRAERAAARGRNADVRRHAARGLDALALWQSDFGSLDLQTSTAMHGDTLVGAGITSAVASGRPDVIFEWSERARHLSLQVVPLRPPPDPSLAADLAELRMLRAEGGSDWLTNARAAELQERARERQWVRTGPAAVEQRVTLDEAQIALDDSTALISYVFFRDGLLALVVTPSSTRIVPLPRWPEVRRVMPGLRADLDVAASVRTGPMAEVVRASLQGRLEDLSKALLDAPADAAGTRRLVVTVPGVLNGIPWAMLPGMRGRAFTVAASASRWVRQREAVAGGDASTASATSASRVGFAVGPRVVRGDEEIDRAASAWTTPTILRHPSVDDVADLAADVNVLHIAAHGRHAVDNPMFSGLELEDGALFGYDIDRIERVPETVVLSACEAGRSSVRWGEEAVGMTRIWLHAGSRSVIAAPVVVADDDACELLAAVHDGLARGQLPAEALAEASVRTGIIAPFQTHGAGL